MSLFWAPDGWCVDLREDRNYPLYGEWDWVARTNNTGITGAIDLREGGDRIAIDRRAALDELTQLAEEFPGGYR